MIRWLLVAVSLLSIAPSAHAQSRDALVAECDSNTPDTQITGCTQLIQSGAEPANVLAIIYVSRGLAFEHKGDHDRAIADFTQALSLRPDYVAALNDRGVSYRSKALFELALADFDRAIALNPQLPQLYDNRASIYEANGKKQLAINDGQAALKLDGSNSLARALLFRLGALPQIAGTAWVQNGYGCSIQEIEFTDDSTVLTRAWDVGSARWTRDDRQLRFDVLEWDATLSGTIVSEDEIDLSFKWTTIDHLPHSSECAYHQKDAAKRTSGWGKGPARRAG